MDFFSKLISPEFLFHSWRKFRKGKRWRPDVICFESHLEEEIFSLSGELASGEWKPGPYQIFFVRDPKFRVIHKATVRDRVVHQAVTTTFSSEFEKYFIFDSYAARPGKGTDRAIKKAEELLRSPRNLFILHADVDDFYASVDHQILLDFLARRISDRKCFEICRRITESFFSQPGQGLPLGNVTSQLFANVYLHELDYFIKEILRIKNYLRYNDDLFIFGDDRDKLGNIGDSIAQYARKKLKLSIPDKKRIVRSVNSGADILGRVFFPWGSVPRKRIREGAREVVRLFSTEKAISYLGLLKHSQSFIIREKLRLSSLYA